MYVRRRKRQRERGEGENMTVHTAGPFLARTDTSQYLHEVTAICIRETHTNINNTCSKPESVMVWPITEVTTEMRRLHELQRCQ